MKTEADTYMIDTSGKLFRKGEHIGNLEGDEMKLLPDKKNYSASVTRWLREESEKEEKAEAEPKPAPRKLTAQEQEAADNRGMEKEAIEQAEASRAAYKNDVEFSKSTGCPPPPKKNPQFGDKTPAYVDWLHKYRNEIWKQRFDVRGKGKVPIIKTNPDTGIDEVEGYRDADMATRKTHLTEKIETNRDLAEDMDWNA